MDVDSTMTTEPDLDHDSSAQKISGKDSENPTTAAESPSTIQQPPLQQPQHSNNSSNINSGVGATVVAGPRCAPTYSVVNATMEKKEDGPGPRCGHTLTAVQAVGEEGTPGYIGPRLILFGGATALEGNSAVSGTPTSAGSAGIRMFSFIFGILTNSEFSDIFCVLLYS